MPQCNNPHHNAPTPQNQQTDRQTDKQTDRQTDRRHISPLFPPAATAGNPSGNNHGNRSLSLVFAIPSRPSRDRLAVASEKKSPSRYGGMTTAVALASAFAMSSAHIRSGDPNSVDEFPVENASGERTGPLSRVRCANNELPKAERPFSPVGVLESPPITYPDADL